MTLLVVQQGSLKSPMGSISAVKTQLTAPGQPGAPAGLPLGPFAHRAQQLHACGVSNWVLKTVTGGYRLQFAHSPPNGILQSHAQGEKAQVLQEESPFPCKQESHSETTVRTESERVLVEVFSGSEKRG